MHAKCMFKCYICIYLFICSFDWISPLNVFSSILKCFHLKFILDGFVHFALIFAGFFHLNVIFKINEGIPNLHCILSHFYVEPLVT